MRFQLTNHGWPIRGGAVLIPTGTVLDRADWKYAGWDLPWPPPVNAIALDQEGYDEMLKHYERHRILTAGDIERHADPK